MRTFRTLAAWAAIAAIGASPSDIEAQSRRPTTADSAPRDSATVVPGRYDSPPLSRSLLGAGWRDLWDTPVKVPILDIGTYAGGLAIDKLGGGMQTISLHLTEKDGWREYRFRSVDKFSLPHMPRPIKGTLVARIIQDQNASHFPAAPILVPPFMDAIGALQVKPTLYVMADDARLGEHRATFAGMLGTMELKGQEAPDDKPGFAGSKKIKGTEKFFEDLAESRVHRVDERELLAVRLIDLLINDGDRTPPNVDWARFGDKNDGYLWRPISRDRDRAFTDARGPLNRYFVRRIYPKFTEFGPTYALKGLTESGHTFDRRLLQRLTAEDFAEVGRRVHAAVTDSVIDAAIAALPPEWRAQSEAMTRLRSSLVARRNLIPDVAMRFYALLAGEIDVHLTNEDERADIVRHADGRVTLTVPGRPARPVAAAATSETPLPGGGATRTMGGAVDLTVVGPAPYYQRTFLPAETNEIRVHLGKGNDLAVIRGAPTDDIIVRVVGDSGADVLADSAGGGATYLYDAAGENRFVKTDDTHVSEKPWTPPEPTYGYAPGAAWRPDWGGSSGWRPVVKHMQGAGLVIGAGPSWKAYGFRRLPHWWEADAAFLVGTSNGRVGLIANADYRMENSPLALTLAARASQLAAFRFYGFGNAAPDVGRELSLVEQNVVAVEPAVVWHVGWRKREGGGSFRDMDSTDYIREIRPISGRLSAGPSLAWTDPQPMVGSPLTSPAVEGGDDFAQVGMRLGVDLEATDRDALPTRGWRLRAKLAAYPALLRLAGPFSTATASATTYIPLGDGGAHFALRAGGAIASGLFPAQYAATIGGSSTLRGYRSGRFAGDRAANGTAELRVPVGTINFIIRSQVGVFGLTDVARVWYGGRSDGGWHAGTGGGVWLSALGQAVSLSYVKGESHRFYVKSGLAF